MIDRKGFIKRRFGTDEPEIERIAILKRHIVALATQLEETELKLTNSRVENDLLVNKLVDARIDIEREKQKILSLSSTIRHQAMMIDDQAKTIEHQKGWKFCSKQLFRYFIS